MSLKIEVLFNFKTNENKTDPMVFVEIFVDLIIKIGRIIVILSFPFAHFP